MKGTKDIALTENEILLIYEMLKNRARELNGHGGRLEADLESGRASVLYREVLWLLHLSNKFVV